MTELIKITTNDEGKQLVSARELHEGLKIGTAFKDWIKRMIEYGFEEGTDFSSFLSESTGGRPSKDYIITIDMAKEICMIQRTDLGREFRKYFIECEKKLKQQAPQDYLSALKQLVAAEEERIKLQQQNQKQQLLLEEQQPKVEFYDDVAGSKDAVAMKEVAKVLGIKGMGRNKLFKFLRDKKILDRNNMPYQEYVDRGYFRVIEQRYNTNNGDIKITFTTLVYNKGIEYIRKLLK